MDQGKRANQEEEPAVEMFVTTAVKQGELL